MSAKILIIEDDLESLKLIGLMLQRRGYEIIAASGGSQGLRRASTENPNLVILDVMMPDMDGYEVCRALRKNPATAGVPVIMFTAKSLPGDREEGYRAGADVYLTKPIHPTELVSVVEELLERTSHASPAADSPRGATVIGVLGAKGGVGASTVTVNLAAAHLMNIKAEAEDVENEASGAVIVDLRTGIGAISLLLGEMPSIGWGAFANRSAHDISRGNVEGQVLHHRSGLRYLSAPLHQMDASSLLTPDHVDAIIENLSATSECVFLDLGSELTAAVRHAIGLCDAIVVVIEPEPLCAYLGQVLLTVLADIEQAPDTVRVVSVGRTLAQAALSPEQLQDVLGQPLTAKIDSEWEMIRQAEEQGEPVVLSFPDSPIARQFVDFAQAVIE